MYDPNDVHDFDLMADEADAREQSGQAVAVRCYKCTAGCIHFEYGNLTLTFTRHQFLTISAAIAVIRNQLMGEEAMSTQVAETVVM